MLLAAADTQPVFVKDMAYYLHRELIDDVEFFDRITHTFLVRHLASSLASYARLDENFTCEEVGLEALHALFRQVRDRHRIKPVVVSAEDLLHSPERTMRAFCDGIGLPFHAHALNWDASPPEDWQAVMSWHGSVAASTGFGAAPPADKVQADLSLLAANERLLGFYRHHLPHYEALAAHSIETQR